jgi:HlyD family secretion protein
MELLGFKKSTKPPANKIPQKKAQKISHPWLIGLLIVSLGGGTTYWYISQTKTPTIESEPITNLAPTEVTALGRLEPAGEVIKLSVANAQDSRVNQLLVTEGDRVTAKQLIATLQGGRTVRSQKESSNLSSQISTS